MRRSLWPCVASLLVIAPVVAASAEPDRAPQLAVGWFAAAGPGSAPPGVSVARVPVRIAARWADVERESGAPDWTALDAAVDELTRLGARVVLALEPVAPAHVGGDGVPSPVAPERFDSWLEFVRSAARTFAGRVHGFEIAGAGAADADAYAFLLKVSVLALRAESTRWPRLRRSISCSTASTAARYGRNVSPRVAQGGRAGANLVTWKGRNQKGFAVLDGVYIARLKGGGLDATLKIAVLK